MLVHNLRIIVNTTQHSLDLVKDFLLMERLFLVFSALLWSSSYFCDDFCWRVWKKLFFFLKSRSCMCTHSSFGSLVLSWVLCQFCTCSPRCRVVVTRFKMWLLTWMLLDWTVVLQYWISSCDVMCVRIWNGHWKQNRHTHYCTDKKGTVLRIVCIIFVNELNGMEDLKWHDIWTRTESVVIKYQVYYFWFLSFFLSAAGEKKRKVVSQFWWRIWDRERHIVLRRSRKRMRWDDENNGQLWEKMVLSNARVSIIIVIMIVVASKKETSFFCHKQKGRQFSLRQYCLLITMAILKIHVDKCVGALLTVNEAIILVLLVAKHATI